MDETSIATKLVEDDLSKKVKLLEDELADARTALNLLKRTSISSQSSNERRSRTESLRSSMGSAAPAGKRGYLFKWQDRTIGWGGTKWSLRFVSLENGRLSYYGSHNDPEPRYELVLRGCAVRDDGFKRNRRHQTYGEPPLSEPGAYFHVFSIYQRRDSIVASDGDDPSAGEASTESEIIPLLRFSTPSMAEKMQWMSLISATCAYCETDEFLVEERGLMLERQRQREEQLAMQKAMPQAVRGTLPPLYFAPATTNPKTLKRTASGTKLPKHQYQTTANNTDAEKVDARSTRGYPPSKPMHREAAPSLLSEEAPVQNYRGMLNLAIILLAVSNARLLLDTYRRYGFFWNGVKELASFAKSDDPWSEFPLFSGFAILFLFCLGTLVIEWLLGRKKLWNSVGSILHQLNAHGCLALTTFIVWNYIESPASGATLLFHAVIVWMKLISYAHANEDYRLSDDVDTQQTTLFLVKDLDSGASEIKYPQNVTLGNLMYFMFAPTLTYQIAFPRSRRVRIWKVLSLAFRLSMVGALFLFLTAQVITPYLKSLAQDLEATSGHFTVDILAEYALKLSLANMYCWLLMFYGFFHLYLNLTGELLRFGDRVFYRDWWNSSEVSAYWRLWNTPVHYWLVRHVYFPCVRLGMSRFAATFSVFFLSAVVHELLISVPFHMIRPWIYMGMMMQIPLVWFTKALNKRLPGSSMSNAVFWMAFFFGQPLCVLLYTIDYQAKAIGSTWMIENQYCIANIMGRSCGAEPVSDEL